MNMMDRFIEANHLALSEYEGLNRIELIQLWTFALAVCWPGVSERDVEQLVLADVKLPFFAWWIPEVLSLICNDENFVADFNGVVNNHSVEVDR